MGTCFRYDSARTQLHYHKHDMIREFEGTLSSGKVFLLAEDAEQAAWTALELSENREDTLLNVKQSDEW